MKKTMVATTGLFLAAFAFTGCGGSAGTNSTQETVSGNENNEQAPQVEENTLHNISYIEGVYDITNKDDVLYLAIDAEGVVNTYDYQADFVDNGMDCYIKNNPLKEVNQKLNGKNICHSSTLRKLIAFCRFYRVNRTGNSPGWYISK